MTSRDAILGFIAVLLLAALLGCAGTTTRESTGEYVDDTVITARVMAAIFNEPTLVRRDQCRDLFKGASEIT